MNNLIPIYLITGFLESGKTSFLKEILVEDGDFDDGDRGLLILCEEGEEEFDEKQLAEINVDVITVEEEEDFNEEFLLNCVAHYRPERILIEMNGMWDFDWLFGPGLPRRLEIAQVITLVDGSTFSVYLNNMRSIMSRLFQCTEMVIFNRCREDMDLHSFRRTVRGLNPGVMIGFEGEDGEPIDPGMDVPPYDLDAEVIQVEDEDYGLWFLDVLENKERYEGRKVRFRAKVKKSRRFPEGCFVPGRNVMNCCEEDIQFVGLLCRSEFGELLKSRQWIWLTAEIRYEYHKEYDEESPVLVGLSYERAEAPEVDTVLFN